MRKIEKEMLEAINRNLICNGGHWAKDNTSVYRRGDKGVDVFLHGNHIAHINNDRGRTIEVNIETLRNYPTVTTKSRLRALGVDICTSKGVTYLYGESISLEG